MNVVLYLFKIHTRKSTGTDAKTDHYGHHTEEQNGQTIGTVPVNKHDYTDQKAQTTLRKGCQTRADQAKVAVDAANQNVKCY